MAIRGENNVQGCLRDNFRREEKRWRFSEPFPGQGGQMLCLRNRTVPVTYLFWTSLAGDCLCQCFMGLPYRRRHDSLDLWVPHNGGLQGDAAENSPTPALIPAAPVLPRKVLERYPGSSELVGQMGLGAFLGSCLATADEGSRWDAQACCRFLQVYSTWSLLVIVYNPAHICDHCGAHYAPFRGLSER